MTAGKDTADLICFQQKSNLQLIAIYVRRAKDDMHTKTCDHGLPLSALGRARTSSVTLAGSQLHFSSCFAEFKNNDTSGCRSLTTEDLSHAFCMTRLAQRKLGKCFSPRNSKSAFGKNTKAKCGVAQNMF